TRSLHDALPILYALPASEIPKNVKMDASSSPNEQHSPIGYTISASHDRNECFSNNNHRIVLPKLVGMPNVLQALRLHHALPKQLPGQNLSHDLSLFATDSQE